MTLLLWLVALVLALFVLWFVLHNRGKWNRIWMLEIGDTHVRLYPNFGFQIGNVRWSKKHGRRPVYKPKKWGLGPGKIADEGTDLWNLRTEYYNDRGAYLRKRGFIK